MLIEILFLLSGFIFAGGFLTFFIMAPTYVYFLKNNYKSLFNFNWVENSFAVSLYYGVLTYILFQQINFF